VVLAGIWSRLARPGQRWEHPQRVWGALAPRGRPRSPANPCKSCFPSPEGRALSQESTRGLQGHTPTCTHGKETPLQAATFRSACPHLPAYERRMEELKLGSRNQPSQTLGECLALKSSSVAVSASSPALPPGDKEGKQCRCSLRNTQPRHGSLQTDQQVRQPRLALQPWSWESPGSAPHRAGAGSCPASRPPAAGLLVLTTKSPDPKPALVTFLLCTNIVSAP